MICEESAKYGQSYWTIPPARPHLRAVHAFMTCGDADVLCAQVNVEVVVRQELRFAWCKRDLQPTNYWLHNGPETTRADALCSLDLPAGQRHPVVLLLGFPTSWPPPQIYRKHMETSVGYTTAPSVPRSIQVSGHTATKRRFTAVGRAQCVRFYAFVTVIRRHAQDGYARCLYQSCNFTRRNRRLQQVFGFSTHSCLSVRYKGSQDSRNKGSQDSRNKG
jgi:hypothetical protein